MLKPALALVVLIFGTTATHADPAATPWIDQRQKNQAQRVEQGVQSGALTRRETRTLEARQKKFAKDEAAAKADGVVTPAERAKLRREERRTSRAIFRKKHNARVAPPAGN